MKRQRPFPTVLFSPVRRRAGEPSALLQPGGPLGRTEWVVPRANLHYRRLDFTALPERRRAPAARIAMLRELQPGMLMRTAWLGGIAHVWSWVPPATVAPREQAGWVPEPLVRPRPHTDGARLLAQLEGVEGQVWRDGNLLASQWWPASPASQAWQRFLRSAGLAPDAAAGVPAGQALGWAAPWARVRGVAAAPDVLEGVAWRVTLAGLAIALGWQVMARESEIEAHGVLSQRIEALRSRAMPLLDARERAEAARAEVERLRLLQQGSSDYSLMPAVTIPLGGARLLHWQRQGEVLKAKVAVEDPDPRRAVDAYTKFPLLADVQATPMPPGAVGLEFTLPKAFRGAKGEQADGGGEAGAGE